MKRTLLTMALAVMALCAKAQTDNTFVFCDADGKEIPDGTVLDIDQFEEDELMGDIIVSSGLYVKNTGTGTTNYASMVIDITRMDNGLLSHCMPELCCFYNKVERIEREGGERVRVSDGPMPIHSEWKPTDIGRCTVTYTVRSVERNTYNLIGDCSTVTVNYYYGVEVSAIAKTKGTAANHATYNLQGQRVGDGYRGVVIRNGKKFLSF